MGRDAKQRRGIAYLCGALVVCALALLVAFGTGCGGDSSSDDAAAAARRRAAAAKAAAVHEKEMALGKRVFATHCQSCHTLAGKHYTGPIIEFEAPNLDEVRMKRAYVEERVEFGGPAMASFASELPRANFRALVTYVTETAGRNVHDDGQQSPDQLATGRQVFAEHCASCHAIEGRGLTGRPVYYGMDFTRVKPSERYVIKRMNTGVLPEEPMMPSFKGKLTNAQMQDVAAYVTAVANEGPLAPKPEE